MSEATNVMQDFSSWRYSSSTVAETIIYTQMNAFDLLQIYKTDELAACKNKKILRKLRRAISCEPSATESEGMAVDEMLQKIGTCSC